MSPKVRAAIFIALTLAWWGLAFVSAMAGSWLIAAVDFLAGAVTVAFAYRSTHPRGATKGNGPGRPKDQVKELRAPRPRR